MDRVKYIWSFLGIPAINLSVLGVASVHVDSVVRVLQGVLVIATIIYTAYRIRRAHSAAARADSVARLVSNAFRKCARAQKGDCPLEVVLKELEKDKE